MTPDTFDLFAKEHGKPVGTLMQGTAGEQRFFWIDDKTVVKTYPVAAR